VLREIRTSSDVPVIVVSARDTDDDKIDALDDGADDYVAKPFSIDELLARVRATLRRRDPVDDDVVLTTKHFSLDFGAVRATAKGRDVHLTPSNGRFFVRWCDEADGSSRSVNCLKMSGAPAKRAKPDTFACT